MVMFINLQFILREGKFGDCSEVRIYLLVRGFYSKVVGSFCCFFVVRVSVGFTFRRQEYFGIREFRLEFLLRFFIFCWFYRYVFVVCFVCIKQSVLRGLSRWGLNRDFIVVDKQCCVQNFFNLVRSGVIYRVFFCFGRVRSCWDFSRIVQVSFRFVLLYFCSIWINYFQFFAGRGKLIIRMGGIKGKRVFDY